MVSSTTNLEQLPVDIFINYFKYTSPADAVVQQVKDLSKQPKPKPFLTNLWYLSSSRAYIHFDEELDAASKSKLTQELRLCSPDLVNNSKSLNHLLDQMIDQNILCNRPHYLKSIIDCNFDDWKILRTIEILSAIIMLALAIANANFSLIIITWAAFNGPLIWLVVHTSMLLQTLMCARCSKNNPYEIKWVKFTFESIYLCLLNAGHIFNIYLMACPWLFNIAAILELTGVIYEYVMIPTTKPSDPVDLNQYELICYQRKIQLFTEIMLFASAVVWNVLPPGLMVSCICVLCTLITLALRYCLNEYAKNYYGNQLQDSLSHPTMAEPPGTSNGLTS